MHWFGIAHESIDFIKHILPWQGIKENDRIKKWKKIQLNKESISNKILCGNQLPFEFVQYLNIVKSLKYAQKPNYKKLINLFKRLYVINGYYAKDIEMDDNLCNDNDDECNYNNFTERDALKNLNDWDIADIVIPDWIKVCGGIKKEY